MTTGQQVGTDGMAREDMQPGAVGRLLRETRESYQQDIAAVSQQLRIRGVYLRAIEDGNYQALPGSTYAVGFVRSYAEYLGLDPLELVRRFRDEAALVNRRTQLVFPVPTAEAKVPSGAVLMIGLVVALLAYGGWYYLSDRDRDLVDMIPAVPESLQEMANATIDTDDESESEISASSATAAEAPAEPAATEAADTTATIVAETPVGATDASDTASAATVPATDGTAIDPAAGQTAAAADITTTAATGAAADTATEDATQTATIDQAAESAAAEGAATETAAVSDTTGSDVTDAAASASEEAAITVAPLTPLAPAGAGAESAGTEAATTAAATTQVAAIPEAPRVPESVREGVGYGVAFAGSRVVIVARMESWVEVQNAEGEAIWARVLRAGDRYLVPDEPGLTMTVGNAGGIDVFVDGDKAPSLGTVGVGRRGVMLDPERLASGTALP